MNPNWWEGTTMNDSSTKKGSEIATILFALPLSAALSVGANSPAAAADFELAQHYTWRTTVEEVYSLEGGRTFLIGELTALLLPEPTGPLSNARAMTCPAVFDVGRVTHGFCFQTDPDGDQIFVAIRSVPMPQADWPQGATGASAGTWSYTGGTGKYEGITGDGTYTANTMMSLPGGIIWGYSDAVGTYALPD